MEELWEGFGGTMKGMVMNDLEEFRGVGRGTLRDWERSLEWDGKREGNGDKTSVGETSTEHMYREGTEKKTVEEIICVNETQRHIWTWRVVWRRSPETHNLC